MADDKKNIPEAAPPAEAPSPAVEKAAVPEQPAPEPISAVFVKDDCVIIEPTQKDLENQGFVAGSICF